MLKGLQCTRKAKSVGDVLGWAIESILHSMQGCAAAAAAVTADLFARWPGRPLRHWLHSASYIDYIEVLPRCYSRPARRYSLLAAAPADYDRRELQEQLGPHLPVAPESGVHLVTPELLKSITLLLSRCCILHNFDLQQGLRDDLADVAAGKQCLVKNVLQLTSKTSY